MLESHALTKEKEGHYEPSFLRSAALKSRTRRTYPVFISRRQFLGRAGTGLLLAESQLLQAQRTSAMSPHEPSAPVPSQSKVAVIHGQERRKIVHVALAAID